MTFKTYLIYLHLQIPPPPLSPGPTVTIKSYKLWRLITLRNPLLSCRVRRTRTQICACPINVSLCRHCSPSSDENFKGVLNFRACFSLKHKIN